ncbi:MAG: glycosyltransferase family 39 protein [Chloroflexi bacterium]|nr:glycosyltransferase family 39 protein [Chloroflexota bacterium]
MSASPRDTVWFIPLVLVASLGAFFLRVVGLADLSMWGDSAYSVYTANLDLGRILTERIYDGHPPLYYYLLHFWTAFAGNSELATRFLSSFWGVLAAPLGAVVGRKLGGNTLGVTTAFLIAASPGLVHYSRLIRMYSLVTFLVLLSLYLFWRAINGGGRGRWIAYYLATLAALYTHYYAALLVVAEGAYFLLRLLRKRDRQTIAWWLGAQFAFAALYLPWLVYAARTQVEKTAFVISHLPAATGMAGLLEQVWISFNLGVLLDNASARPLSLAFIPLASLGFLSVWRNRSKPFMCLLFSALLTPIAISFVVIQVFPFAVRPRFLLIYAPVYLTLLGMLMLGWRGLHRFLAPAVLVGVAATQVYALSDAYRVERHILEPPSIMLTQHLDRYAQPGDAVVFHANWQIGYFTSHFRGAGVATHTLDEIEAGPSTSLRSHKRVWLVMSNAGRHDPRYPLEQWLDSNWARLGEWQLRENRAVLFARPPGGDWETSRIEFRDASGEVALRLTGVRLGPSEVTGGGFVTVGLRWEAARALSQRYTMFIQLLDSQDRLAATQDSEPWEELKSTDRWKSGDIVETYLGLLAPLDLPQDSYRLIAGVYPTGAPGGRPRLTYVGASRLYDTVDLHTVRGNQAHLAQIVPANSVTGAFDGALELFGYETDLDSFQPGGEQLIHPLLEETVRLTFPKDAYEPGETLNTKLYWRIKAKAADNYGWRLELADEGGQPRLRAEGQLLRRKEPTSIWQAGQLAITEQKLQLEEPLPAGRYSLTLTLLRQSGTEPASLAARGVPVQSGLMLRQLEIRKTARRR